jgi:DNA-binding FrmR family transcriptional regulator
MPLVFIFLKYPQGVLDRYPQGVYNGGILKQIREEQTLENCCCHKTKKRDTEEYTDLIHRLNRIEGQVRGVRRMVEEDAYCVDILTQVSAITAALNSFNKVLLGNHIRTCVAEDVRNGREEKLDELVKTMQKLMK